MSKKVKISDLDLLPADKSVEEVFMPAAGPGNKTYKVPLASYENARKYTENLYCYSDKEHTSTLNCEAVGDFAFRQEHADAQGTYGWKVVAYIGDNNRVIADKMMDAPGVMVVPFTIPEDFAECDLKIKLNGAARDTGILIETPSVFTAGDYTLSLRVENVENGHVRFSDVKVERGTNPTPVWTPAPSEMVGKDGAGFSPNLLLGSRDGYELTGTDTPSASEYSSAVNAEGYLEYTITAKEGPANTQYRYQFIRSFLAEYFQEGETYTLSAEIKSDTPFKLVIDSRTTGNTNVKRIAIHKGSTGGVWKRVSATGSFNGITGNTNALLQLMLCGSSDGSGAAAVGTYAVMRKVCLTKGASAAYAPSANEMYGSNVKAVVERNNFTDAQWAEYGRIDRNSIWDNTESIRNDAKVGDIIYVVGTSTDSGNSYQVICKLLNNNGNFNTITLGMASAKSGLVITAGAGLTLEGGALRIANNANLPGSPTTTTQAGTDNSTKIATTEFVQRNFAKLEADNNLTAHGNEFNFVNPTATKVFVNYRRKNNTDNPNGVNEFLFMKGLSSGTLSNENLADLRARKFLFPNGAEAISSEDVGMLENQIMRLVKFPSFSEMVDKGYNTQDNATNEEAYFKAVCKWAADTYNISKQIMMVGIGQPNSLRCVNFCLYSNRGNGVDATTKLPRYSFGNFTALDGRFGVFGTNDYTWYFNQIMTQATSINLPGSPTTTTQAQGDNSTKIATTAYVDGKIIAAGIISRETPTSKTSNWKIKTNITGIWSIDNQTYNDETAFRVSYSGSKNAVIVILEPMCGTGYMFLESNGLFIGGGVGTNTLHSVKFVVMNIK